MTTRLVGKAKLKIQKFDPVASFKEPFNMVVLGHKHTGKSTFMKDIIYHLHKCQIPRIVVFSGTEDNNHFYSTCIPREYIYSGISMDVLQEIINSQREIVKTVRGIETKLGRGSGIDTRLVVVLDDCMYNKNLLNNETFRYIFMNGRHSEISIILSSQYLMWIPSEYRSNIDLLVCMRENIPKNRMKLYESFFGCFPDRQTFYTVLDQLTQNYECLILDTTGTELNPEAMIRWYKASHQLPRFVFTIFK